MHGGTWRDMAGHGGAWRGMIPATWDAEQEDHKFKPALGFNKTLCIITTIIIMMTIIMIIK